MKFAAALAALFLLGAPAAFASDTVRLKSGETKTGQILAEEADHILLKSDSDFGVVEIKRSDISILDKAIDEKKGGLSFVSTVPKKKRKVWPKKTPASARTLQEAADPYAQSYLRKDGEDSEEAEETSFEKIEKMFADLMAKKPEIREWFEKAAEKSMKKSEQLDELVDAAKQR